MKIEEYHIIIKWSKAALMQFIARVPAEYYRLCILDGETAAGVIIGTETIEFITNEIFIQSLTKVEQKEIFELQKASKGIYIGTLST